MELAEKVSNPFIKFNIFRFRSRWNVNTSENVSSNAQAIKPLRKLKTFLIEDGRWNNYSHQFNFCELIVQFRNTYETILQHCRDALRL